MATAARPAASESTHKLAPGVEPLRDAPVAGVPLPGGAQLDDVEQLPQVQRPQGAHAAAERDRVLRFERVGVELQPGVVDAEQRKMQLLENVARLGVVVRIERPISFAVGIHAHRGAARRGESENH